MSNALRNLSLQASRLLIGIAAAGLIAMVAIIGWQVIGRTPKALFRVDDIASPTVLRAGDHVRFVAIDAAEYARTKAGAR